MQDEVLGATAGEGYDAVVDDDAPRSAGSAPPTAFGGYNSIADSKPKRRSSLMDATQFAAISKRAKPDTKADKLRRMALAGFEDTFTAVFNDVTAVDFTLPLDPSIDFGQPKDYAMKVEQCLFDAFNDQVVGAAVPTEQVCGGYLTHSTKLNSTRYSSTSKTRGTSGFAVVWFASTIQKRSRSSR